MYGSLQLTQGDSVYIKAEWWGSRLKDTGNEDIKLSTLGLGWIVWYTVCTDYPHNGLMLPFNVPRDNVPLDGAGIIVATFEHWSVTLPPIRSLYPFLIGASCSMPTQTSRSSRTTTPSFKFYPPETEAAARRWVKVDSKKTGMCSIYSMPGPGPAADPCDCGQSFMVHCLTSTRTSDWG